MKRTNKFLAMTMACALSLSLAVPAMAVNDGVLNGATDGFDITGDSTTYGGSETVTNGGEVVVGKEYTYKDNTGHTVPFVGIIKPTQIKATIPTKVVFDIDPTKTVWETGYSATASLGNDQVTAPNNIVVKNNSTVPMWVYVSSVTTKNAELINTAGTNGAGLSGDRTVMFGLATTKSTVTDLGDAGKANWIVPLSTLDSSKTYTAGADNVYKTYTDASTNTHYILESTEANGAASAATVGPVKPNTADGATPGEMQLYINAVTKTGYKADETFTVMPVLVVAVKSPDDKTEIKAQTVDPATNVLQPTPATPATN